MKTFIIPEDRIQFMMRALVKYDKCNDKNHGFLRARAIHVIKKHLEFINFIGGTVSWAKNEKNKIE